MPGRRGLLSSVISAPNFPATTLPAFTSRSVHTSICGALSFGRTGGSALLACQAAHLARASVRELLFAPWSKRSHVARNHGDRGSRNGGVIMAELMTQVQPPAAGASEDLRRIDAYWRACTYLAAGMIYLRSNPLLRAPLKPEHIKQRLLGHWGTSPGLSFAYVHLNRLINKYDLDAIFLAGPGHGAPGVLAPVYLEGTY